MKAWCGILLLTAGLAFPQQRQQRRPAQPPPEPDQEEEAAEPEYSFNPIQAQKEIQVGDFYWKKKSYRAAAGRYERATKWQPDLGDAYFKLGEAREKLEEYPDAVSAYQKYLELNPSGRKAGEVKKKIAELQGKPAKPHGTAEAQPPKPGSLPPTSVPRQTPRRRLL